MRNIEMKRCSLKPVAEDGTFDEGKRAQMLRTDAGHPLL